MARTLRAPHQVMIQTIRDIVAATATHHGHKKEQAVMLHVIQLDLFKQMMRDMFFTDAQLSDMISSLTTIPELLPTITRPPVTKIDDFVRMGESSLVELRVDFEQRLFH